MAQSRKKPPSASKISSTSCAAIAGRSTLENLRTRLQQLALAAGRDDRILLVLIGHGTYRNDEARFNLPGPDVTGAELGDLLDAFETQTVEGGA